MEQPSYICLELLRNSAVGTMYVFSRYNTEKGMGDIYLFEDKKTAEETFLQWNRATNREENK